MSTVFAEKLAESRHASGISQREASQALGISQALLSHYEKGIREPGLDFVVRAARYYGVTTDYLLGYDEACYGDTDRRDEVSEFALKAEQDVKNTLDLVLQIVNQINDPELTAFITIYLSEAVYECFRHLDRMSLHYDPEFFCLSDHSFDSGALVSDMTWVRTQLILASRKYVEGHGQCNWTEPEQIKELYPRHFQSGERLMKLVGVRIAQQEGGYAPPPVEQFRGDE